MKLQVIDIYWLSKALHPGLVTSCIFEPTITDNEIVILKNKLVTVNERKAKSLLNYRYSIKI